MIQSNQREFLINHIVDRLTVYLMHDYNIDLPAALNSIYESKTYDRLQKAEYELFTQSPSYIYEILKKEIS